MELIDFVKNALKQAETSQMESDGYKYHVQTLEKLEKSESIVIAWNEVTWQYSRLMADIRKIREFIETWQTFEN